MAMISGENGQRQERDNRLVSQFVQRTIDSRRDYYEWIQEEVKACLIKAQYIESTSAGEIKRQARRVIRRLRNINTRELVEITNDLNEKCDEIKEGAWDDRNPMDAYHYLEEGMSHFKTLVDELIPLRRILDGLVEQNT